MAMAKPEPPKTTDRASSQSSSIFWIAWHTFASFLVVVTSTSALDDPLALSADKAPILLLVLGYFCLSLYVVPIATKSRSVLLSSVVALAGLGFGGIYFFLRLANLPESPGMLALGSGVATVCVLVPYLSLRVRVWTVLLVVAAGAAAIAMQWSRPPPKVFSRRVINTALYSVNVDTYTNLVPPPKADGGALARHNLGVMLATGDGKFYWLAQAQDGLRAAPLAIPDVMAREAYLRDFDDPSRAPRLRLTDVLIEQSAEPKALYLAHQAWDQKSRCYTLQLSTIALTWSGDGSPRSSGQWRTIFESKPCIKATGLFDDSETGGRLAWGPDGELLLSLGDLGFAGLDGDQPYSQRRDVDYGKIVKVDPRSGRSSIFSVGHRNPEGLLVASDGRIWESEHGPQGGDEINLIAEGENYGWPLATYGAEYGSHAWPLNPDGHDHGAFHEPAVAFVPSVALSSMIELAGPEFPHWKGDLIAASLRTETLYRLRLKGDRVIYVEPLPLGYRIRDLIQRPDGKVIVWSDTGTIMELSRDERDDAYDRTCSGCHEPRFGGAAGPPLAGVLGRRIASVPGFNYSAGLKSRTGRWSESELDAFLRDPDAYAPGTTMKLPGLDDESRAQVIAHLAAK